VRSLEAKTRDDRLEILSYRCDSLRNGNRFGFVNFQFIYLFIYFDVSTFFTAYLF